MTRPRTPRAASEVASSSPNIPSLHGEVAVTTSRSSSSTSGLKPHISGWCGSNRNTGGAPIGSPGAG